MGQPAIEETKEQMITIPKSTYDKLTEAYDKLTSLEQCGVDNWCGYDDAMNLIDDGMEL